MDSDILKINYLAVRPERVEGGKANYGTVSIGERDSLPAAGRGDGWMPIVLSSV